MFKSLRPGQQPTPQRPLRFPESGAHRLALRSAERGEPPLYTKHSTGPLHRAPGESHFLPTRPQVSRLHQDRSGGGGGEQLFWCLEAACLGPPSLSVSSQDLLPVAWRRLSGQWLGFPLTAWKWTPGHRSILITPILRAVGSGARKILYETQACPLSSIL